MEGLCDYVKIHLKSTQRPLLVRTSLKALEPELSSSKFIRIHKSYIVAIDSISAVRKNGVFLNELELPVGETYKEDVDNLTIRKRQPWGMAWI